MRKTSRKRHPVQPFTPTPRASNINTQSCALIRRQNEEVVKLSEPGSFCIEKISTDHSAYEIWLKLPGGGFVSLPIGLKSKPAEQPSWEWDGDYDRPTLSPSVWFMKNSGRADEWHGWIRNGRMESV